LYQKSAAQGYVLAQYNLGFLYDEGRAVPQNFAEAAKWYRLAAAQKHAQAQNNLGAMYLDGQGVAQDYVRAHMWLNFAAAQGVATAITNREIVAGKLTPEQLAQAQELARKCQASNYKQCD